MKQVDNEMRIQRSMDYIEENLRADITVEELAAQAGFSPVHYSRIFQSVTGLTAKQYLLRRRLLHGIYRIRQGSNKVEAALEFGFDTYAGFYKAFCREFGCSPREYLHGNRVKPPYRIRLEKEEPFVTHKKAARILQCWNLAQEPITDIYEEFSGRRKENACYVGENYVLKYTTDIIKLKNHIAASKAVERAGVASAVPIPTTDGREYVKDGKLYYFVSRRLPGKSVAPTDFYAGDAVANARLAGERLGVLHQALRDVSDWAVDADLPERLREWALPEAKAVLGLSDAFCDGFLRNLEELYPMLPRQVIHRDPNPGNMISGDEIWGFLDFDLAERNVRIYDLCYAATAVLSESFGENNELWWAVYRNMIRGYDNVAHLTPEEVQAIPCILLANQFVCVAWFAAYEKFRAQYTKNLQMTRWLMDRVDMLKITEGQNDVAHCGNSGS